MITLPELRVRAARYYERLLSAHLLGTEAALFPLPISANKTLDRAAGLTQLLAQQQELLAHSKHKTGFGYELELKPNAKTRQSEIRRISFPTPADLLHFIGKADEFAVFARNAALIRAEFPELLPRLAQTPRLVNEQAGDWPQLLAVCRFFQATPQPRQYVRSLAIVGLDSKFIERHQTILRILLDEVVPPDQHADDANFFRRFHLQIEDSSIRLRFLDERLRLHPALSQLSVWVSEFRELAPLGSRVFVIENLTSFLMFPAVADSLAIWGGGFAVSQLADVPWLAQKELFYWGDIDVHGFQILAQFRAYYPSVQSLLMDLATFRTFRQGNHGSNFNAVPLPTLYPAEQALYQELLATNERLEQEQIPAEAVINSLRGFNIF